MIDFHNLFFWNINKTYQCIICEIEIRIVYIKKHVYKDRKETTHVEVGEEKHTSSSYMKEIKYNVRNKMVTRPEYKRLM